LPARGFPAPAGGLARGPPRRVLPAPRTLIHVSLLYT